MVIGFSLSPITSHLSPLSVRLIAYDLANGFAFVQSVNPIKVWVASCEDYSFHLSPFTFNL